MRSRQQRSQARSNQLTSYARSVLHAPTASEAALWLVLRGGAVVSRSSESPLGERHIADFFAPAVGLVVEVDGALHRIRRTADRRRDEKLRRLGYRVVRVDAALVLRCPERTLAVFAPARPVQPSHGAEGRAHPRPIAHQQEKETTPRRVRFSSMVGTGNYGSFSVNLEIRLLHTSTNPRRR